MLSSFSLLLPLPLACGQLCTFRSGSYTIASSSPFYIMAMENRKTTSRPFTPGKPIYTTRHARTSSRAERPCFSCWLPISKLSLLRGFQLMRQPNQRYGWIWEVGRAGTLKRCRSFCVSYKVKKSFKKTGLKKKLAIGMSTFR